MLYRVLHSVIWHCWLGIRKSIWPAKYWVLRSWHDYLSGTRCKWFAYCPADTTATPIISCFIKIHNGLAFPFLCQHEHYVLKKRPLNWSLSIVVYYIQIANCSANFRNGLQFQKWKLVNQKPFSIPRHKTGACIVCSCCKICANLFTRACFHVQKQVNQCSHKFGRFCFTNMLQECCPGELY